MYANSILNNRAIRWLVLLPLPALLVLVSFQIRSASGPYWFSENLDPSYAYLMNSLNIANLHRPNLVEHPGTPIQIIGALIIRARNLRADETTLARTVLHDPDAYLRLINNVFIMLAALCLLLAGYLIFRTTGDLFSAVVLQSAPFLSAAIMRGLFGMRSESFFVSLAIVFSVLVLLTLRYDPRSYALKFSLAFGVLAGLGMATKINFLPLLLIPLIVLSSWKWRAIYALTTGGAFLFFILPILAPSQVKRFFSFTIALSTHTGRYGTGAAGIVSPSEYARNAVNLITTNWLFFLIVAISGALLIPRMARVRLGGARRKILLAVTLAQLLQFLIVAKHPGSHYLVPAMGLVGVNLIVLFDVWREAEFGGRTRFFVLAVVCAALLVVQVFALRTQQDRLRPLAARQRGVVQKIQNEFKGVPVIDYYTASSAPYALKFGVEYSGDFYGSIMEELYPGSLFYNPWTQQFSRFSGPVELGEVQTFGDGFVMHGYSLKDSDFTWFLPPNAFPHDLILEPVYGGNADVPGVYDGEAIYRARFRQD